MTDLTRATKAIDRLLTEKWRIEAQLDFLQEGYFPPDLELRLADIERALGPLNAFIIDFCRWDRDSTDSRRPRPQLEDYRS